MTKFSELDHKATAAQIELARAKTRKQSRIIGRIRLWCRLFGHDMHCYNVGHDTGVEIFYCTRCPHWWTLS